MGLLIVPSIFFREVDRLAFDSSVFSAVLQTEGWLPEVPGVLPKQPVYKPLLLTIPRGATNSFFFFFLQVMESLTTLHLHVLRYKRELLFDLVTA